ncbi:MAG: Rrf2 family transcriptional regulator, partial [Clostridia bacterium]|nr:Rrf2 family transcriptional regulator [Clostridia bacterium]
MKISTKGRYALRLLVDLAEHSDEGFVPLKELATRQQISLKYAESIVSLLVKGELLLAERGASGGYRLARPADSISVATVLTLTEGSLHSVACLEEDAP